MNTEICQSCGFVFTKGNAGTTCEDTLSILYCKNCLEKGKFTDPSLSIHNLELQITEMAKNKEITLEECTHLIHILPRLKRWQMKNP